MKERHKAYLYLVLTTAAWGSSYVAGKYVMESIPSFTLLLLRHSIAVIVMAVLYKTGKHEKIQKEDLKYLLIIGILGYFGATGLQLTGVQLADASLTSLINSINPIAITIMAMLILKEKATVHKIIAIGVTVLGAAIIIGHIQGRNAMIGAFLSVGSVMLWSYATVLIRFLSSKYDSLTITFFGMLIAIPGSFVISAVQIMRAGTSWDVVTPGFLIAILYLGVVCTFAAFALWNKALSMVDAATCSLFYPIQPFVASLLGALFLGEVITGNFILGGLLIAGGILYSIFMDSKSTLMDSKSADVKISGEVGQGDTEDKP